MRVATVDIGTNTVLLLVAERGPSGDPCAVAERATITRLGEGVDRTRRLAPAAVERTRDCLREFARTAIDLGAERFAVVGTSAMRDAGGSDALRAEVRALFGVEPRVLSGDEEARLTFRGAKLGLSERHGLGARGEVAVFDIGGGSTEVVVGLADGSAPVGSDLTYATSFDVGSVRLTERHLAHDPPTRDELRSLWNAVDVAFRDVPALAAGVSPIGVAGTMTTLASVSLGLAEYDGARVHGSRLETAELRLLTQRMAAMRADERRRLPGMEPKRADVIVAGAFIALALLDHWKAAASIVSDRGLRWGLAEDLLGRG